MQIREQYPKMNTDFDPLIKYMELLQKRTESTLVASVVQAVETCKTEINENLNDEIALVTTSVNEIKMDLSKLEKSVDVKLRSIQSSVEEAEKKADEALSRARKIEEGSRLEKSHQGPGAPQNGHSASLSSALSQLTKQRER